MKRVLLAGLGVVAALTLTACTGQTADQTPAKTNPKPSATATSSPAPKPSKTTIPSAPAPTTTAEEVSDDPSDHCGDQAWWEQRQIGDPGDYVAACGVWPEWVDRGDTPCLPDEQQCPVTDPGPPAYTGPTAGRDWSPEYGYYEGRTDGPKNSYGQPCMQGRDNNDPNC